MMSNRQALSEIREDLRVVFGSDGLPEDKLTIGQLEGIKSLYANGRERKTYAYGRYEA